LDISLGFLLLLAAFFLLILINFVEIRLYIFLALLCGVLLYFYLFSARLNKLVVFLASFTVQCARVTCTLFSWPKRLFDKGRKKVHEWSQKNEDQPEEEKR
jgi:thiol:disulfide interchange protein